MSDQKVMLITGASSGVGQATARLLAQNGYKVFGTSRNPATAPTITNVEILPLDVCSDDSVAACVGTVTGRAGRLDVLVNNAGYELAGASEDISLEEAKAQFETNFFGVIRMVKAVLPLMRRQRHGQIINVSSLAGFTAIPFMGMYTASKFALEGYTEALRLEVKPFNIHVSLIESGFLKTPMMDNRQIAAEQTEEYDPWRQRAFKSVHDREDKGPGPELPAEAILRVINSKTPRLHNVIGREAKLISQLRHLLPERTFEKGARNTFRLDQNK